MWSVLPFGLLVTAVNGLAVQQVRHRLPVTPPEANADTVRFAIEQFPVFGLRRTLVIAAGFLPAALVYCVLAWAVRRGDLRWPSAVILSAGVLVVVYALGCGWVYDHDPVIDFRSQVLEVPPGVAGNVSPWNMESVAPGWYRAALAWLLILSVVAQCAAVVLVTRAGAVGWMSRPAATSGGDVDAGTRRAALLLMSALGFVAAYAVVNAAAIRLAASGTPPLATREGPLSVESGTHLQNLEVAILLAVWAVPLATYGVALLRRRARPGAVAMIGCLSPGYLLTLWWFTVTHPMTWESYGEYNAALREHQPGWHEPVLYGLLAAAVLVHLAALGALARCGVRPADRVTLDSAI
ncbi:MAG: hypothetical protein ACRDOO_26090 [Actinomadura sp.]